MCPSRQHRPQAGQQKPVIYDVLSSANRPAYANYLTSASPGSHGRAIHRQTTATTFLGSFTTLFGLGAHFSRFLRHKTQPATAVPKQPKRPAFTSATPIESRNVLLRNTPPLTGEGEGRRAKARGETRDEARDPRDETETEIRETRPRPRSERRD